MRRTGIVAVAAVRAAAGSGSDATRRWYGEARRPHFGTAFAAARRADDASVPELLRLPGVAGGQGDRRTPRCRDAPWGAFGCYGTMAVHWDAEPLSNPSTKMGGGLADAPPIRSTNR